MAATAGFGAAFGELLLRHRLATGLSQRELAVRGRAERAVRDLERGATGRPRQHSARAIANALGLVDAERATLSDITVVDRATLSVLSTVTLATAQNLADVAVNSRTNRVYLSNFSQGFVHVLDGATNAELPGVNLGRACTAWRSTSPPTRCTWR